MKYVLIIGNQKLEIGIQLESQPFQLFSYEELGILCLKDWENLMMVHLYEDRIVLKKTNYMNGYYFESVKLKGSTTETNQYSASDIIALMTRGYRRHNKGDDIIELYRPPSGFIHDENGKMYTKNQMMNIIESSNQGFILVKHHA